MLKILLALKLSFQNGLMCGEIPSILYLLKPQKDEHVRLFMTLEVQL